MFKPLIRDDTHCKSLTVQTLKHLVDRGELRIAWYQRDDSQWTRDKQSLFIDSLINRLSVPPITLYPMFAGTTKTHEEVVDGQQRINTVVKFLDDGFALSPESEVDYSTNLSRQIANKLFSQLDPDIKSQILGYLFNCVVLPRMRLNLQLEIFRRINEGGVPLSAQDLRLAFFNSQRVEFIRLAGIFDEARDGQKRMLETARDRHSLAYPWTNNSAWKDWWNDKSQAIGEAPSQMFLYYVIARDLDEVDNIVASKKTQGQVSVTYDNTTASVLDLYCAVLKHEDSQPKIAKTLPELDKLQKWFKDFELWFNHIRLVEPIKVSLNSSSKVAFFIAFAAAKWTSPSKVTGGQWKLIEYFLTQGPENIQAKLGLEYPSTRGKWPGQKRQIECANKICQFIKTHK